MVTVAARSDPQRAQEGSTHRLVAGESAGGSNFIQAPVRLFEVSAGGFKAQGFDVARRCDREFAHEGSCEVPGAHCRPSSQGFDRKVLIQIFNHPDLEFKKRVPRGSLSGKGYAELSLTSRPPEEQHKVARYFEGCAIAEILFYKTQGKVHAGGHSGRSIYMSVLHPDGVWIDLYLGVARGKFHGVSPVGRCPSAVE